MGLEDVPRCQHVKVNGTQCGSPALRRKRRCYFHNRMRDARNRYTAGNRMKRPDVFTMCLLEDANAVQVALMQVLQLLGSGQMDYKMAGLMLFGLQTASCNLRHTRFEAEQATDVVIDRSTVNQTCLNGPQWFAHDFAGQADAHEDTHEDTHEDQQSAAPGDQAGAVVAVGEKVTARARARARKIRPSSAAQDAVPQAEVCRNTVRAAKPPAEGGRIERARKFAEESTFVRDFYLKLMPEQAKELEITGQG
jgi:hypothetical protein